MSTKPTLVDHFQSGKPWLLVVDDDLHMLESTKDILEEMDFTVHAAKSGEEALAQCNRNAYNALVVDFSLPDITGIQLAEKAKEVQPHIVTILMTGHSKLDQNLKGHETAIDEYLTKPVDPPHLMETLKNVLQKQRARLGV